ncbi:FGGY-family carbohydrate kinase [Alicyclobacillus sp. ALC3]|uniref:FGGY-family carbohydrate kinase n=1 Tax=Alicyclobacillus sp. ALC3 TaxID=2796143 RepID=UPI00237820DD|nr:FGGY-family carbohydrate kinase [Alicyclobacillus sp. ALC3]WDL95341.1 FGGY-family carbohydrate kinase [Alicyclobacillus sp. ALC3]
MDNLRALVIPSIASWCRVKEYVIGIDIGTTAIKLIALDETHRVVYEQSRSHPLYTDHVNWAEEDAELWWHHTRDLLQGATEALRELPGENPRIRAIGVSGMVPAIVLLDENGRPLRRSIQQNDARCTEQISELQVALEQDTLYERTGGYTNQQHVLPRLLWVKKHEPEVWKQVRTVVGSYDWIVHCLTGEWSLEENWAAESGLFDIRKREFIPEYLVPFGVSQDWFPQVRQPLDIVGTVQPSVAEELGLDLGAGVAPGAGFGLGEGVSVIAGTADHIASALSAGVVEEGDLLIKFGGAGDILFCSDELVTHDKLFFDYHDIPGKYLLNGCMASSGSLVRWFVEQFVPFDPQSGDGNVFHALDDQAEGIGPGSDGLVILPYLLGEKTPIFDPKARGVFFGLSLHHTPAHVFRAILESVIYGFRHHIDVLAQRDLHPKRVFATNGGAKSRLWLQIASDILGLPLTSFRNHPGSSLGAAFLAGKAVGMYRDWSEVLDCLSEQQHFAPNADAHATYNVTYGVYRRLYEVLKDDFHEVSDYFQQLPTR